MFDASDRIRDHYRSPELVERIEAALPGTGPLDVVALAALDQFHTRGLEATAEIVESLDVEPRSSVLDVGCGIGGPARFVAATRECRVTGLDLSAPFIAAARYLTTRCNLSDRVDFVHGDALDLPFEAGRFDHVLLQHVAMNIADRDGLYREVARVLKPGGRFATHDVVVAGGAVHYPVPWARDPAASVLRDAESTCRAIEAAGFRTDVVRDDTLKAVAWFQAARTRPVPDGPTLALVMGADFPALAANLGRNLSEGRLGVLFGAFTKI